MRNGEYTMLFMGTLKWEPGRTDEIMQLRMKEKIPSGMKIINEWVALETNLVYRLVDITEPVALAKSTVLWADIGYIEMHPVMATEDLLMLRK